MYAINTPSVTSSYENLTSATNKKETGFITDDDNPAIQDDDHLYDIKATTPVDKPSFPIVTVHHEIPQSYDATKSEVIDVKMKFQKSVSAKI